MATTIQSLTWSFGGDFKNKDPVSQQVWHGSNLSVQKGHGAFSLQPFTVDGDVSMRGIFSSWKLNHRQANKTLVTLNVSPTLISV